MSTRIRMFYYLVAGLLGGIASWAFVLLVLNLVESHYLQQVLLGGLVGVFVGIFVWSIEGIASRETAAAFRGAFLGGATGLVGGMIGGLVGTTIFQKIGTLVTEEASQYAEAGVSLGLTLGWMILGFFIGGSGGIIGRSRRKAVYGIIGGSIGGFSGGLAFNHLHGDNIYATALGLGILGGCIGFFIGLVEEMLTTVKLTIVKGRNEGKEFPVLKDIFTIGRDDRCDICLSGCEGVAVNHAEIHRQDKKLFIQDLGSEIGVYVNDVKTERAEIGDGDLLRLGSIILMVTISKGEKPSRLLKSIALGALLFGWISLGGSIGLFASGGSSVNINQFDLSEYPLVKAYISVLNADSDPVRDASGDNFAVFENDEPVTIRDFNLVSRLKKGKEASFALVLDKSESMKGEKIEKAKTSIVEFIRLMEKTDRGLIITFADKVTLPGELSRDKELLMQNVNRVEVGGHTALYDAIYQGAASVKGLIGRKAVIVLTDGIANRGQYNIGDAIDYAVQNYTSVYVIGLGKDVRKERLSRIARETGGEYFFSPTAQDLPGIYETISRHLKNEYLISYRAPESGEYLRNVKVTLSYQDETETAERKYFQPESTLFGAKRKLPPWVFLAPVLAIAVLLAFSLREVERRYDRALIRVVRGHSTRNEFPLEDETVTLGRDERNTIGLFRDPDIEQFHAEIRKEDGHFILLDKESGTGSWVNHQRIPGKAELKDGDIIGLGTARLLFRFQREAPEKKGPGLKCPGCQGDLRQQARFCPHCGKKL
ncbi:MAG: VWA domain-containing protein [Deltaproteobacteria bacterium]|nr:MAG: VWA domain-containing protein [Deltaproteobacteria bacterium]